MEVTAHLVFDHHRRPAIPPEAQHLFANRMGATTMEVPSSHAAMVSHPDEVTRLIKEAAKHTATVV
jgi:hypothetical protein